MEQKRFKKYLCVVCKQNEITESVANLMNPWFDPSNYLFVPRLPIDIDYRIEGGRLISSRPKIVWNSKEVLPGGICDKCLQNEAVKAIIDGGYLHLI